MPPSLQSPPSPPPLLSSSLEQRLFCVDVELNGWALAGDGYEGCQPVDERTSCCMTKAELDASSVGSIDVAYRQACRCPTEGLRRECQYLVNDQDEACR